jgi:uncharacterized protein (TIGR00266 family)
VQFEITGSTIPVLQVLLNPGEVVVAETGQLAWMAPHMTMNTTTQTGGIRGLFGAIGRALSGGGLFMTEFTPDGVPGQVAFAAHMPGQITQVDVAPGRSYMLHRNGFLCGMQGVTIQIGFQKSFSGGLFGGNGFVLQKLSGYGTAWIELGGDVVIYDLPPGASVMVHPGLVGMFQDSVAYEMTMVSGVRNMLFGGDGLFLVRLTGPGRIWLQTLSLASMAHALQPYLERSSATVVQSPGSA